MFSQTFHNQDLYDLRGIFIHVTHINIYFKAIGYCWIFKCVFLYFLYFQLYSLPKAAIINNHQWGGFRNLILSHFWMLEVQNLGVCRFVCPLKSLEEKLSLLLSNFCWLQADLDIPQWLHHSNLYVCHQRDFFSSVHSHITFL